MAIYFLDSSAIVKRYLTEVARAMDFAEAHRLRGYDAVQLAAAVAWQQVATRIGLLLPTFVSADTLLNAAAVREGLTVDNPLSHP